MGDLELGMRAAISMIPELIALRVPRSQSIAELRYEGETQNFATEVLALHKIVFIPEISNAEVRRLEPQSRASNCLENIESLTFLCHTK